MYPLLVYLVFNQSSLTSSLDVDLMLRSAVGEGMVVGHSRSTQTKGVWMWKAPVSVQQSPGQPPLSMLYFDTEGFESTGKSDAYDDRIFALAAVISSTLVYNLAETVRESDIEKLSFAVDLAQAFYNTDRCVVAS